MAKNKSSVSMLQVPNNIVRNENGIDLTASGFALYCYLKHLHYLSGKASPLPVSHSQIMTNLNITDLRTFKKLLKELYENDFLEEITFFPKRGNLILSFNVSDCTDRFTQLPTSLLRRVEHIGHIGFRLLYYYESFINRTIQISSKAFCFSSYKEISTSIGISQVSLSKYNEILKESNLLKITKHRLSTDLSYSPEGKLLFEKFNNHYSPLLQKM